MKYNKPRIFIAFLCLAILPVSNVFAASCFEMVTEDVKAILEDRNAKLKYLELDDNDIEKIQKLYDEDNQCEQEHNCPQVIAAALESDICPQVLMGICGEISGTMTQDKQSCGKRETPANKSLSDIKQEIEEAEQRIKSTDFFESCEQSASSSKYYTLICRNSPYKLEILYDLSNATCPDGQEVYKGECREKEKTEQKPDELEESKPAEQEQEKTDEAEQNDKEQSAEYDNEKLQQDVDAIMRAFNNNPHVQTSK